jgi:hypothetical protein
LQTLSFSLFSSCIYTIRCPDFATLLFGRVVAPNGKLDGHDRRSGNWTLFGAVGAWLLSWVLR